MAVRQVTETFMVGTANAYVSNSGSTSTVALNPPVIVPTTAVSIGVKLRNSYIWNVFPNVDPSKGNRLRITHGVGNPFTIIEIPTGQYSLDLLNESFARESILQSAYWVVSGDCKLSFEADEAQQKIYILNKSALGPFEFDWDESDVYTSTPTMWKILGFNQGSKTVVPAGTSSIHIYADNRAEFNNVNQIVVLCNLISKGIRDGGNYRGILAQVPITQPPGHLMIYEPDLAPITEPALAGLNLGQIIISLQNEKGEGISTIGNDWFVTIDLSYDIID
jgi:hypothetical protein